MDKETDRIIERKYNSAKKRLLANPMLTDLEKELVVSCFEERTNKKGDPLSWSRKCAGVSWLNTLLTWSHECMNARDITKAKQADYRKLDTQINTRKKKKNVRKKGGGFKQIQTNQNFSANSRKDMRKEMRVYLKWVRKIQKERGGDVPEFPDEDVLKLGGEVMEVKDEHIPTEEQIHTFLAQIKNPQQLAFFNMMAWDVARPHELRSLTMAHLHLNDEQPFMVVPDDSKTGSRPIDFYESTNAVFNWINIHPDKDNPEAKVFNISEAHSQKLIRRYFKAAGIPKSIPAKVYNLRHFSYTYNRIKSGKDVAGQKAGHRPASKQGDRYSHFKHEDLRKMEQRARGILLNGKVQEENTTVCVFCGVSNPKGQDTCCRCRRSLDLNQIKKAADEFEGVKKQLNEQGRILKALVLQKKSEATPGLLAEIEKPQ